MEQEFSALQTVEDTDGKYVTTLVKRPLKKTAQGNVLIRVRYSSLNYKDALSATGNKGVTRNYPHTPGIDAAGIVAASNDSRWTIGQEVILTGFDLGMNTDGGLAQYIEVPAHWLVALPQGLTLRESMALGTAGLTAALSVNALIRHGVLPPTGKVAVSGATGGVGSIAVAILSRLGYEVTAISSKSTAADFLHRLGAREIIQRSEMDDHSGKALLRPRFAAAVDTVGGNVLATLVKSLQYGGIATTCGMVNGVELPLTIFPFILKGIHLAGIDSVEVLMALREKIWHLLASEWKPAMLEDLVTEIGLEEVPAQLSQMLAGKMQGRIVVNVG